MNKLVAYGAIIEPTRDSSIQEHNTRILNKLPEFDEWPPLAQSSFSFQVPSQGEDGPITDFGGRVIHFAFSIKASEDPFEVWRIKFEALLNKLVWESAHVHWKMWWGAQQHYKWERKHEEINHSELIPNHWTFTHEEG